MSTSPPGDPSSPPPAPADGHDLAALTEHPVTPQPPAGPELDAALALALGWERSALVEMVPEGGARGGAYGFSRPIRRVVWVPSEVERHRLGSRVSAPLPWSTRWDAAGELVEQLRLYLEPEDAGGWAAGWYEEAGPMAGDSRHRTGATPPEAIARAALALLASRARAAGGAP